jgi:hypothetical protein
MNNVPAQAAAPQFKFDVAISFLSRDAVLGQQISDLISPTQSVFFSPRNQETIAGSDGLQSFVRVFAVEARVVVVLFRQAWGETPWTRIEKDAILDRVLDRGSNFALFIVLEPDVSLPDGIPKRRIYYDYATFGLDGVAGAIKTRVAAMDGDTRPESPVEHALRAARASELRSAQKAFLAEEGVARVAIELPRLGGLIADAVERMNAATKYGLAFEWRTHHTAFRVRGSKSSLIVNWRSVYANTLDGSELKVRVWTGRGRWPDQPDQPYGKYNDRPVVELSFRFGLIRADTAGWFASGSHHLESEALSDELLHLLLTEDQKLVHAR